MTKLEELSSSILLNEDTDAQRGKGTSPKSHSKESGKGGKRTPNCAVVKSEMVHIKWRAPCHYWHTGSNW